MTKKKTAAKKKVKRKPRGAIGWNSRTGKSLADQKRSRKKTLKKKTAKKTAAPSGGEIYEYDEWNYAFGDPKDKDRRFLEDMQHAARCKKEDLKKSFDGESFAIVKKILIILGTFLTIFSLLDFKSGSNRAGSFFYWQDHDQLLIAVGASLIVLGLLLNKK